MRSPSRRARRAFPSLSLLLAGAACADLSGAPRSGTLAVRVEGLPDGAAPAMRLVGRSGAARTLAGSATVAGLTPGEYTLSAKPVTARATVYAPAVTPLPVRVDAGAADSVVVRYAAATGALAVRAEGAPADAATLSVEGMGVSRPIATRDTLRGLLPGRYTVRAGVVTREGAEWVAEPAAQELEVRASETPALASVRYHARVPLDLVVEGVTLTQSVQRADDAVPLVAGRPALLRVFVRASERTDASPRVRVRWYLNGAVVDSQLVVAAGAVPVARADGVLASTWNAAVPGALVRPGLAVTAEVDPDDRVPEADEANNVFPASGASALDVRAVPAAAVTLVPVTVDGATGAVDAGSAAAFLDLARRALPLGEVRVEVRAPFASSAPALQSADANGAWQRVLAELLALRTLDGSDATYYGVVRTPYATGAAGLALVGAPVAVGWDAAASAAQVTAHELGHTWGRMHAPCGSTVGVDPAFPDGTGATGAWGWDAATGRLRAPETPDLMGYCGDPWVSEYTFVGIMRQRELDAAAAATAVASPRVAAAQPCLLVWGRVTADGRVLLEPAFEVPARPALPARGGAHRVRGVAADGATLFALDFDATPVADGADADRPFAFAVPLDADARARLAGLRVSAGSRESAAPRRAATEPQVRIGRDARDRGRVRWDADAYPVALLRDAATGRVLGFARGGEATVPSRGAVELVLSDGVRSRVARVE